MSEAKVILQKQNTKVPTLVWNLTECFLPKQKQHQQHTPCNKIHKSARKGTFIPTWLIFVFSVFKILIICMNIFQFFSLSTIQDAMCVNCFSIFSEFRSKLQFESYALWL